MKLNWTDLTIEFRHLSHESLLEDWVWLIGKKMSPVMISSIGDVFLKNADGKVYWLDVGVGELKEAASDLEDLKEKMKNDDIANEWFMFELVSNLKESGLELEPSKLYGYKNLPIIGGAYEADNFELTDIEVHFSIWGQFIDK